MTKVIALAGSPRKGGNTDTLLDAFIAGAKQAGAQVELFQVRELNISPCTHCGSCEKAGVCIFKDDHPPLAEMIQSSDIFVFSAPVFFCGYPAISKAFIDRFQAYWVRRYELGTLTQPGPKGFLLSVGGTRGLKNFDGLTMTFKYLMHSLNGEVDQRLVYPEVDARGEIEKHPVALEEAQKAGYSRIAALASGGKEE
jgi:multimeric flavodoxin WrbA